MTDPVRLKAAADAPVLAVEALEQARADAPDAARLGGIEAGVLAKLRLPPDGGGGSDGGSGSGGSGGPGVTIAKVGTATLAVGAVIAAIVVVARNDAEPPPIPPKLAAIDATPAASASPTAVDAHDAASVSVAVEDLPSAPATATRAALPSPEDPAEAEKAEVALLAQAQAALPTRPAETFARCEEHARRFAQGTLVQEREVLAIDALIRLNRRVDAEARAARFRAAFPKSGHLRRVETLLAH